MTTSSDSRLPGPERRAQLLRVALEVFSATGYHETSMNDIALRAGVTKPVLYQHFTGKQELYLELVGNVSERLVKIVRNAEENQSGAAPGGVDNLTHRLTAYFRFVESERRAFALLFGSGAPRDEVIGKAVRTAEADVVAAIASNLPLQLDQRDRSLAAEVIAGAAEAAAHNWASNGFDHPPEQVAEATASLLWFGLREIGT